MHWLIHTGVTPAAVEAMTRHGQQVRTLADVELTADAPAEKILQAAGKLQLELLTADAALAGFCKTSGLPLGRCAVYLQLPGADVEQDDAIDRLFSRYKRLSAQRVYTLTEKRVKIQQTPLLRRSRAVAEKEPQE